MKFFIELIGQCVFVQIASEFILVQISIDTFTLCIGRVRITGTGIRTIKLFFLYVTARIACCNFKLQVLDDFILCTQVGLQCVGSVPAIFVLGRQYRVEAIVFCHVYIGIVNFVF